jgi:hypothetical protein
MRDMHRPTAVALVLAAVVTAGLGARAGADTQAWAGCDSFDTQPEAQAYWESHGRPAQADGDNDGKVCESLPTRAGAGEGCERPRKTVTVRLSRRKYPEATLHFEVAWRQDVPSRYTIARGLADENRDAWDPLVPAGVDADGDGNEDDRDEVPMAFTKEGGRKAANGRSASHIAYVDASDNRGAGSSIGGRLRRYCNGTRFKLKLFGRRTRTAVIVVALRNGRRVHQVVRRR